MSISLNDLNNRLKNIESIKSSWSNGSNSYGYWCKENSTGLIIQWGKHLQNNNYMKTMLPTSFSNADSYNVIGCGFVNGEIGTCTYSYSTNYFHIRTGGGYPSAWIAIGYLVSNRVKSLLREVI